MPVQFLNLLLSLMNEQQLGSQILLTEHRMNNKDVINWNTKEKLNVNLRSIPDQPVIGLPLRLFQGPNPTAQSGHPLRRMRKLLNLLDAIRQM